jgi:hypothetical protein
LNDVRPEAALDRHTWQISVTVTEEQATAMKLGR